MKNRQSARWVVAFVAGTMLYGSTASNAYAQQVGTIRGEVRAVDGSAIQGAQVSIPDLQVGALTTETGSYQIADVPVGAHTVAVQVLGYGTESREVTVRPGSVVVADFTLQQTAVEVEELVVTALGISREERALGYAVDNITGENIAAVPVENISSSLAGKAAGLQIKNLGTIGGSSSVTLRGFNSISGSNQALFIVDGVPVDNSSNAECNTECEGNLSANFLGGSGIDYGNAIQALNPQDIQSISVLKGANAAALYGSRAANGVILITTKKGANASGFQIEGSVGVTWKTPLRLPTWQNEYGGGQVPTDYRWENGAGAGFNDATDESWGPPTDGTMRSQWWSESAPFLPSPYSPRKFFQTGHNATSHVAVSASGDDRHIRFSTTHMDAAGLIPNSALKRLTSNLAGGLELTDAVNLTGAVSYVKTEGEDRPVFRGYPGGMGVVFSYWQRQNDVDRLRSAYLRWRETGEYPRPGHPEDRVPNWNHNFFDSPFYTTDRRSTNDTRDRLTGHIRLEYQINDWISAMARVGTDLSTHRQFETFPAGSLEHPEGEFINNNIYRQETNAELLFTADFNLTDNFQLTARGGGNLRGNNEDRSFTHVQRLNVPGVYNVGNSAGPPLLDEFIGRRRVNSVYGLMNLSYRDLAFLDLTGRNDWSSTLPKEHNSYFYPSVSASLILTDFLDMPEFLSYAKLRGSWARVGSDADPYQLRSIFTQGQFWESTPSFTHPDQLANRDLRPEETVSWEVGTDLRFADDRASLDLTYYKTNTSDQILPVAISHTTGYAQRVLNAGEVQNQGVEAVLDFDILRDPEGLTWTAAVNWATNKNKVISLTEGLQSIVLGTSRGLTVEARVGEEYGALLGQVTQRNEQGQYLVDFDGRPIPTETKQVIGHFQPDWLAGLRSTFGYQGVSLNVLFDIRQGGNIFCQTCAIQRRTGQLIETLEGREAFELVHPGVKPDGTPNDVPLPLPVYHRARYRQFEHAMYDASFLKLREVVLGFPIPESMVAMLPFSSGRISVVGRDLLLFTDVPHIDPELNGTSGNAQGMELFLNPSPRSIGFTISFR